MNIANQPAIAFSKKLNRLAILICLHISLSACSGGIFGTGDGDDIIIIGEENIDADASPNNSDSGGGTIGQLPDGGLSSHSIATILFPQQLMTPISDGLNISYTASDRFPTPPVTHQISGQLNALSEKSNNILVEITQLEATLIDSINQCSSPCQLTRGSITTTASQNTVNFQTSAHTSPETAQAVGDQSTFNNLTYANQLNGYYDQSLSYTRNDGTEVFLGWSNDRQLVSTLTTNAREDTYILADLQQATSTLRYNNKLDTTTLHAVIVNNGQDETLIEADWHGTEEYYIRALANATSTTLFSLHPTDRSATHLREHIALPQLSYTIESCRSENTTCDNWLPVLSDEDNSSNPFITSQATIGNFSETWTSGLPISLPADVNEYVISTAAGGVADQATTKSLVCAGQRVFNSLRTFCWQPLPLEGTSVIFEESLTSGAYIYRQLPGATF